MHTPSTEQGRERAGLADRFGRLRPRYRRVVACVDETYLSRKAIAHGAAIANALGAEFILMHVLETKHEGRVPLDPVEWDLRRRQAQTHIENLAHEWTGEVRGIQARLVEGSVVDRICSWMWDHQDDLAVLCTHGHEDSSAGDLGGTVRRVIDCTPGSLLLVPSWVEDIHIARYPRVLVPLDGSSRAESALPVALRICRAQGVELLLVHAVPEPEITEAGPLEPEGMELRSRLINRNERVGRTYLDRVRSRIANQGVRVRTLLVRDGDSRRLLCRTISDDPANLAIIASHGQSGHADTAAGGVASYMIAHLRVPLLIVRDHSARPVAYGWDTEDHADFRFPKWAVA